jgi:hypothetical protein
MSDRTTPRDGAWLATQRPMFATPCYGGTCTESYLRSMLELTATLLAAGVAHRVETLANESLITRARNRLVQRFLASDATHLFFIDADLRFRATDVLRLIAHDRPIVAGAYPAKVVHEDRLIGRSFETLAELRQATIQYVVNVVYDDAGSMARQEVQLVDGLIEAHDAGTGFLCVKRHVIEELIAAHPETRYIPERSTEPAYALFDTMIDEHGRYLSEDYTFCRRWQGVGGTVWIDPTVVLDHVGTYVYAGRPLVAGFVPAEGAVAAGDAPSDVPGTAL